MVVPSLHESPCTCMSRSAYVPIWAGGGGHVKKPRTDFLPNVAYLVYAQNGIGSLSTNTCTRTKPLVDARGDLDELGAPLYYVPVEQSTWGRIKALYER